MMLGPKKTTAAFCDTKGNITTEDLEFHPLREKYPILGKPFIRGIFSMYDTMKLGMKALELSAEKAGDELEDEPESKFEKWLTDKFGDKLMGAVTAVASVLGIVLAVVLFILLPTLIYSGLDSLFSIGSDAFRSIFEGVMRIIIFIGYLLLVSKVPDIKRTFMFHGAEHKTIFCYEAELPLTVENVKKQTRFHPRCGTSFLVIMIGLGIIIGFFIPFSNPILRTACKILTLPLVVNIGYELIKVCGKYDNKLTKIIAAPGLLVQRITTKEPTDKMMETAIAAMEAVIPENGEDLI